MDIRRYDFTMIIPKGNSPETHDKLNDYTFATRPARKVHTKGAGWHGEWVCDNPYINNLYGHHELFNGKLYPVIARGSKAVSDWGTPDTARNVTAMSFRIKTPEANYDFLNNHIPVFGANMAYFFDANINAFKSDPETGLSDPNITWKFLNAHPEALMFYLYLFSDLGTTLSYGNLNYFGVNTFVWIDKYGKKQFAKHRFVPHQEQIELTATEAAEWAGKDPDISVHTINKHLPVMWDFYVYLMDLDEAEKQEFDPLNCSTIWDESIEPLYIGQMKLIEPADAQLVDDLAFNPTHIPGCIEFSHDDMLLGRIETYADAQRHRLGHNFKNLEANLTARHHMNIIMGAGELLNTQKQWPKDYYTQPARFIEKLPDEKYTNLVANIINAFPGTTINLAREVLIHFDRASPKLAADIRTGIGLKNT